MAMRKTWCPVVALDAGQLWRNLRTDATHKVVSVHGGQVLTRSVEGVFRGSDAEFVADYERILERSEREALKPSRLAALKSARR